MAGARGFVTAALAGKYTKRIFLVTNEHQMLASDLRIPALEYLKLYHKIADKVI